MKKEEFFEVLGELDDDVVKGAKTAVKKKFNWIAWGAVAACLAVVIIAGSVISQVSPVENDAYENETVLAVENLTIYYLSESGVIESKSVELRCTPEDIFNEWAALNNISDVSFVSCFYDNGGSEKRQGSVVEYTAGSYFTLKLTVSAGFSSYAESDRGDLLVQSLRQTFCDYIHIDEFELIIHG